MSGVSLRTISWNEHASDNTDTATLERLTNQLQQDPGLPVRDSTRSYWQQPPHKDISDIQSSTLLDSADVVIIGSGITGCSTARQLLHDNDSLRVVMLDARAICSGATGRNGGHVKAVPEVSYADLEPVIGKERAQEVVRFTLANVEALFDVAKSLSAKLQQYSEIRRVNSLNVFTDDAGFARANSMVERFDHDNPTLAGRMRIVDKDKMADMYGIAHASGGAVARAGAVWPYRLITGMLADLLDKNKSRFHVEAHTPVEAIEHRGIYRIQTSRGIISAGKVIHATNGHVGHLLPGLRGPLFPIRGQMTAQEPHAEFGIPEGSHSWSIHYGKGFDYVTQSALSGEIFIGGALTRSDAIEELGNPRDDANSMVSTAHLAGVMDAAFGRPVRDHIKSQWTGTMGFTSDGLPIVGEVPREVSGRDGHGEFVAAGYNGYGMANAWLCGKYIADLVLGNPSDEPIPSAYALTKERLAGMDAQSAARTWLNVFGAA